MGKAYADTPGSRKIKEKTMKKEYHSPEGIVYVQETDILTSSEPIETEEEIFG